MGRESRVSDCREELTASPTRGPVLCLPPVLGGSAVSRQAPCWGAGVRVRPHAGPWEGMGEGRTPPPSPPPEHGGHARAAQRHPGHGHRSANTPTRPAQKNRRNNERSWRQTCRHPEQTAARTSHRVSGIQRRHGNHQRAPGGGGQGRAGQAHAHGPDGLTGPDWDGPHHRANTQRGEAAVEAGRPQAREDQPAVA